LAKRKRRRIQKLEAVSWVMFTIGGLGVLASGELEAEFEIRAAKTE
jgi:hypothetical protein